MKGVELPINVMVIVVLAIIVLIAIAVLFFGVWNPSKGNLSLETAKDSACQTLVSNNCETSLTGISVSGVEGVSDLDELCRQKYFAADVALNTYSDNECKALCGCSSSTGTTAGGSKMTPLGGVACSSNTQCCKYSVGSIGSCLSGTYGTCTAGTCSCASTQTTNNYGTTQKCPPAPGS